MKPASTGSRRLGMAKLMVLGPSGQVEHSHLEEAHLFIQPGDLLVVNRSGTLPSSFHGRVERSGDALELRLAAFLGPNARDLRNWQAVSFGSGSWKIPTEDRGPAPAIEAGDRIIIGQKLGANVHRVSKGRKLRISFQSPDLLPALYKHGKPIQYAYHQAPLAVWDQQTLFSGPAISVEPPSASLQLSWHQILDLQKKGVRIASLLHSAGISSTGDPNLDADLPLPEWYEVPETTLRMIDETKARGGRVIAVGTTVVRALEAVHRKEGQVLHRGWARRKITDKHRFQRVDNLLSGMHEDGASHLMILHALCPVNQVEQGRKQAVKFGYLGHEYGDLTLLACQKPNAVRRPK